MVPTEKYPTHFTIFYQNAIFDQFKLSKNLIVGNMGRANYY